MISIDAQMKPQLRLRPTPAGRRDGRFVVVAGALEDVERDDDLDDYENVDRVFRAMVSALLTPAAASSDWQCNQCGAWFTGEPSQTCPACGA